MIFYPRTIKLYLNQVSQVTNNESDLCDENREKLKRDRERAKMVAQVVTK